MILTLNRKMDFLKQKMPENALASATVMQLSPHWELNAGHVCR